MSLMAKVLRLSNRQLNELHSLAIKIADTKQMVLAVFLLCGSSYYELSAKHFLQKQVQSIYNEFWLFSATDPAITAPLTLICIICALEWHRFVKYHITYLQD